MFFYLHDDKGDNCTIVDNTVIGNALLHSFLVDKFVCFGLNINSKDGRNVSRQLNILSAPHI